MSKKIGNVIHYFDKINVAVVKLTKSDLKVGDKVKLISREGKEFEQEVTSMQIEHANIDIARQGDEFGLKVQEGVKDKSGIFKL